MIKLPNVTLICLTSQKFPEHLIAIERSRANIEFGAVKMICDLKIDSIDEWNRKIVYELGDYVQTPYALLIHHDGYVINPELWNPEWLSYDYIGAPWPLPRDNFSYKDPKGKLIRVGNSVSLRSKRLLDLPKKLNLEWKPYYGYTNEDGFLCCHNHEILEQNGCVFAPLEVAVHFSKEHEIAENRGLKTFMFHSL